MSGKVHHDCPNSGNLFHECNDQCFERISSRDVPKKEKKRLRFRMPAWNKETSPSTPALVVAGNRSPLPSYYAKRMVESDESPSFSSSDDTFNANLSTPRSPLHGNEADPVINWLPMSPSFAEYCKKDCFSSKFHHCEGEATIHDEMSSRTRLKTPEHPLRTPQHRPRTPERESVGLGPDTGSRTAEHRSRNPGPRSKTLEPRGMYIEPPRPRIPQTQPVSHRSLESAGLRSPQKVETQPQIPETKPRTPVSSPKAAEYRARSPRPQSASSNIGGNYHYAAKASKNHGNKADSGYTEEEKECLLLYPEIEKRPTSTPITPNRTGYEAPKKHNQEFDQMDESKSINHNNFSFLDGSVYVHSDETARTLYQKPRKLSEKQSVEPPELPDGCMKALKIYETGEEMESVISESYVSLGSYKVRASVSATLQQILDKHGDIGSNSTLQSLPTKSYSLETLAAVVLELQLTPLNELKETRVLEMLAVVKDVESVKIRAGWLREILDEILEAAKHYYEHKTTVVEKEVCERDVRLGRVELEKILKEVKLKEDEVKDFRKGVMEMAGRLGELEMKRAHLEKLLAFLSSKVDKFQGEYLL
ncbi:hypothetical protein V5N11_016598 [Cardamine amara subsp. amara]|uniref:Phospholipase-like protein n=1 Tax=Cardamine amara subsp. amara TaxID=228776 RepID=A0ABD0Z672_CARAN